MVELNRIEPFTKLYRDLGFNIIPLKPKTKEPAIQSWKEYQTRRATSEEINKWWLEGAENPNNLAIITGEISGDLAVLDFDSTAAYENALTKQERERVEDSTIVVSTGKGYHVYFTSSELERNQAYQTPFGHVDVRGEGGYVAAAPSIHPTGRAYTIISKTTQMWKVNFKLVIQDVLNNLGHTGRITTLPILDYSDLFLLALKKDEELKDLFEGRWTNWIKKTRSEAEFRLIKKLVLFGFSDDAIRSFMPSCQIGKWQEEGGPYQRLTLEKARRQFIQSKTRTMKPRRLNHPYQLKPGVV